VRVSPLQLGAMSIGDKWHNYGMGSMDKESSFKLLDAFFDAGVSSLSLFSHDYLELFSDYFPRETSSTPPTISVSITSLVTSSDYVISQDETSEAFIGEWAEKRGIRDQLVIATKVLPHLFWLYLRTLRPGQYTTGFKRGQDQITHKINYAGNHAKSLRVSVDASLKKLRTAYIDILYLHWWDHGTSVEEVVDSLHALVLQGKVLYLVCIHIVQPFTFPAILTTSFPQGISDSPAWVVSKANQYAKDHGKTPFCIYQGNWSILEWSFERDIIPMARSEGLALAPWGVLGGGKIRSNAEEARHKESGEKG